MAVYTRSEGVMTQTLDDETVVLDMRSGMYFRLNPTGTLVWDGIDARRTLDEIAADIAARCDVPLGTVRADVATLLDQLVARRLVAPVP